MTPRQPWSLTAAILGSGIVFLNSAIVTVALPQIGEQLATSRLGVLEAQSYIYNGYLLSLAYTCSPSHRSCDLAPELDTSSAGVRAEFSPLNPPPVEASPGLVEAAAEASTDVFSFAMVVAAGLLGAGAVVSAVGIRDPETASEGNRVTRRVAAPVANCASLDVDCLPEVGVTPAA